jgi:predicted nucleic acid-binding protein
LGKKPKVLIDTDILIGMFRGNVQFRDAIIALNDEIAISHVTVLELYAGCKTKSRIIDLAKQLKAYKILPITEEISNKTIEIVRTYTPKQRVTLGDAFIASTAPTNNLQLFTANKKDFEKIKGIVFYAL